MYKLKNTMEELVSYKVGEIINMMNICKCEKCRMDIMALSLNNLPPHYVVTDKGELYSRLKEMEQQYEVDVETEIIKAAIFVAKNPRHEE